MLLLNLQERVNARRKEHIRTIRLPVRTRLLQHYRNDATKVDQHGKLCLWCLVLVELQQLLNGVLYPNLVSPTFFAGGQVKVLWLQEPLMEQGLLDVVLIELLFTWMLEEVLI